MRKLMKPIRVITLIVFLFLILAVYIVSLYDLQVVNAETWIEQGENNRPVEKTVEATRGSILDRNGTVLVSNRSVNNIVLDWTTLYGIEGSTNDLLLELVEVTSELGYSHTDTLPVSDSPFSFTDMSSTQEYNLQAYIDYYADELRAYDPYATEAEDGEEDEADGEATEPPEEDLTIEDVSAVQLMAFMRNEYNIKAEYTAEETRIIAGIRYEIDMRYIIGMAEYIFVEDAGVDLITRILEGDFPGVEVQESSTRRYHTTTGAHLLGRVGQMDSTDAEEYPDYPGNAYVGKEGIEKDFEEYLHGLNGTKLLTLNANGTVIGEEVLEEAEPGSNVITTLDSGMSGVAESALETTITQINAGRGANEEKATAGAAVAIDPRNGEVLTMVSSPGYSLENYTEMFAELEADESEPLINRATQGTYTPGSTYKMATALAGLMTGKITEYTSFYCDGKYHAYEDAGYAPTCMGNHGWVDLRTALAKSCNVYFYELADMLTMEEMADAAHALGLGELTGIGFGEVQGQASTREAMALLDPDGQIYDGQIIQIGIGQGASLFTPIQLANYVATIANGGTRYKPHLLKEVISYDSSEVVDVYEPEVLETIDTDPSYFTALQEGMVMVTTSGTASSSFTNFPVTVAAKTGTAETSNDGGYEDAVFVCYAPAEDPQVAIAVVIEKGGAGADSIPVAKAMLEYFFQSDEIEQEITYENTLLS